MGGSSPLFDKRRNLPRSPVRRPVAAHRWRRHGVLHHRALACGGRRFGGAGCLVWLVWFRFRVGFYFFEGLDLGLVWVLVGGGWQVAYG